MTCPNCAKSIRTDNGMAFHASWCKAPAPKAAPIIQPATIRPKARRIGRRSRRPQVDRNTPTVMHPVLAHILRGEPLPDGYRILTPDELPPTPEPAAILDALTLCNGCDAAPMAANAAGYCDACETAAPTPEPTTPAAAPVPKTRKARAPKSGKVAGLTYADGVVLLAGGLVRVSREAGDYSAAVLAREAAIARGKSRTLAPSIGIEKLRPSYAPGFELGPWKAWGDPAPKAAPVARRSARRPVGPGSCWCPRDHKAPATVAATLDPNRYATRFFPKTSTYAKAA